MVNSKPIIILNSNLYKKNSLCDHKCVHIKTFACSQIARCKRHSHWPAARAQNKLTALTRVNNCVYAACHVRRVCLAYTYLHVLCKYISSPLVCGAHSTFVNAGTLTCEVSPRSYICVRYARARLN